MEKCSLRYCNHEISEESQEKWVAFDLQKGQEVSFCSAECLSNWMKGKLTWMIISLIIGVILAIGFISEMGVSGIIFLFIPYIIRQLRSMLSKMFDSGVVGEIFSFVIVILGGITMIYPIVKLIQEIREYMRIKFVLSNLKA